MLVSESISASRLERLSSRVLPPGFPCQKQHRHVKKKKFLVSIDISLSSNFSSYGMALSKLFCTFFFPLHIKPQ